MAFVVAPGRRVQQDRTVFTEGQTVQPDQVLLDAGILIEVPDPPSTATDPIGSVATETLDINTATSEQLVALRFIGEATATRIIEHRPYESLEQVQAIAGLSRDKWESVASQITV